METKPRFRQWTRVFTVAVTTTMLILQPTLLAQPRVVLPGAVPSTEIAGYALPTADPALMRAAAKLALAAAPQLPQGDVSELSAQTGELQPQFPTRAVARMSAQQAQALLEKQTALRDRMAAEVDNNPPGPLGPPLDPAAGVELKEAPPEALFHGPPGNFQIGRNNLNTQANDPFLGLTLAEPVAVNNADIVFAAGNTHAEVSFDGGVTWFDDPLQPGPVDAEFPCCDSDAVLDNARRVGFHSVLYVDNQFANGVVRIHVRPNLGDPPACFYDIGGGIPNVFLPDFPHLGLTKRHLFLSTNEIGGFGQRARMYRFPLDAMADCGAFAFSFVEQSFAVEGQRVWVPFQGTNNGETMYWAHHVNPTTMRLFQWNDNAPGATTLTRGPLVAANFADPDCRGGANNTDYIQFANASIIGFNKRGTVRRFTEASGSHQALTVFWQNAGIPPTTTGGTARSATFRDGAGGFAVVDSGFFIFGGANTCVGFPEVTSNSAGDLGMVLTLGGRAGGGGPAVSVFGILIDEFGFRSALFAAGTHNPPGTGRYGDYLSIRPYEPCEQWFSATAYTFNGGAGLANVNSRYVEFGRNRSFRCYNSHTGQFPNP